MPEENQNPFQSLFDTLSRSAFLQGNAVKIALEGIDSALRQEIETKFNALQGEDSKINAVLTMLQKITDAEPGSPEWDEGQNLYTLISEKYVALADKTDANGVKIADLEEMAQTMAGDLSNYNQAVTAKIDKEITDRQEAVSDLQSQLDETKSQLATANQTRTEALAALDQRMTTESNAREEKDEQQQAEINTLKNRVTTAEEKVSALEAKQTTLTENLGAANLEITGLKAKQGDLLSRMQSLEGFFTGLGNGTELANEFARGLKGQSSAYGHSVA